MSQIPKCSFCNNMSYSKVDTTTPLCEDCARIVNIMAHMRDKYAYCNNVSCIPMPFNPYTELQFKNLHKESQKILGIDKE